MIGLPPVFEPPSMKVFVCSQLGCGAPGWRCGSEIRNLAYFAATASAIRDHRGSKVRRPPLVPMNRRRRGKAAADFRCKRHAGHR